jgi:hypothetical protein
MRSPFEFRWSVDLDGYEIRRALTSTGPGPADAAFEELRIYPLGGPHREYRPIEGLWRRFAECCTDESSALAFVQEFGLLFAMMRPQAYYSLVEEEEDQLPSDSVKAILATSAIIRRIIVLMDSDRHVEAAKHWSRWTRPRLTAGLVPTSRQGRYEFELIPVTLSAALLVQAGVAIAEDQEWRHCRNDDCAESFRVGIGARTKRSEFCSDRCRVAWARHHKTGKGINA